MSEDTNFRYEFTLGPTLPDAADVPVGAIHVVPVGVNGDGTLYLRLVDPTPSPGTPLWVSFGTASVLAVSREILSGFTGTFAGGSAMNVSMLWQGVPSVPAPFAGEVRQINVRLGANATVAITAQLQVNGSSAGGPLTIPIGQSQGVLVLAAGVAPMLAGQSLDFQLTSVADPGAVTAAAYLTLEEEAP